MTLFLMQEGEPLTGDALAHVERLAWFMATQEGPEFRVLQTYHDFGGVTFQFLSADYPKGLSFALHTDDWCAVFYRKAKMADINPATWEWGKHCYDGKVKGDYSQFNRDIIFASMAI